MNRKVIRYVIPVLAIFEFDLPSDNNFIAYINIAKKMKNNEIGAVMYVDDVKLELQKSK